MKRKYKVNDDFFDVIDTEEKAYWLGFLSADGCITRGNILKVRLAKYDENHLSKFLKSLKSDNKIYRDKNSVEIQISSQKLCDDLTRIGITRNKSLTIKPINLPTEIYRHYWRGIFDGDGSICKTDKVWKIVLYGTESICYGFREYCEGFVDIQSMVVKNRNIYQFPVAGIRGLKILNNLYLESNLFLERKYELFLDYKYEISQRQSHQN